MSTLFIYILSFGRDIRGCKMCPRNRARKFSEFIIITICLLHMSIICNIEHLPCLQLSCKRLITSLGLGFVIWLSPHILENHNQELWAKMKQQWSTYHPLEGFYGQNFYDTKPYFPKVQVFETIQNCHTRKNELSWTHFNILTGCVGTHYFFNHFPSWERHCILLPL